MTNTDTADAVATAAQVADLARAGSELVRITVNSADAARAVPEVRERLERMGVRVPLVGDFHFNGHKLLTQYPDCATALDKYRINPGNVGQGEKRDTQFATLIEIACKHDKPVRIGVNWGSLDQALLAHLMDENAKRTEPLEAKAVMFEALIRSALDSAQQAEQLGLAHDRIILSCKMSGVQDLIRVYRDLAARCDYALHLGLTEAGMGSKGIVASTAALAVLLQEGIGDTIRISLTPEPGGDRTTGSGRGAGNSPDHGPARLRTDGDRLPGLRPHHLDRLSGARVQHSGLCARADARMAAHASGRRKHDTRGHGLCRERPGREQTRQYRHQPAGHGRDTGRAGVRRRPENGDTARRAHCRGISADRGRIRPHPLPESRPRG